MAGGYVPALRFRALTRLYDPVVALTTRERTFKRRVLELAAPRPGERLLDLACGTGTLAIAAARRGAEVTGVDGDLEVLERARAKARAAGIEVRFDVGLSTELRYPDDRFEAALSTLFFHHLDDPAKRASAEEVARVLRPGGRLIVADWGRPQDPLMRAAFLPVRLLDGFANTAAGADGRLPELLESAGLRDVRVAERLRTPLGTLELLSAGA